MNTDLDDMQRALDMLGAAGDTHRFQCLVFDGPPKSKTRPRVGKRGVYTPSQPNEEKLAWFLRSAHQGGPEKGNVAIACVFYRPNRQRIDADNMMKLVMDAATGILWDDDDQVTFQCAAVELDRDHPRTVIAYGPHESTLRRGVDAKTRRCPQCGADFTVDMVDRRATFCSSACKGESLKQDKHHPGQGRGRKGQPPKPCGDCGAPLSKRSYVRCRDCWKVARAQGIS